MDVSKSWYDYQGYYLSSDRYIPSNSNKKYFALLTLDRYTLSLGTLNRYLPRHSNKNVFFSTFHRFADFCANSWRLNCFSHSITMEV